MEAVVKVLVPEGEARLIVKGVQWLPSGDIDKDTPEDFDEAAKGRENLAIAGRMVFLSLVRKIPEGYRGELEFEVKIRTDGDIKV
jgi:hypothetical protein